MVKHISKKEQEAYQSILNRFPMFPPYVKKSCEFLQLSLNCELYKDKRSLFLLQQQSHLAEWYAGNYA